MESSSPDRSEITDNTNNHILPIVELKFSRKTIQFEHGIEAIKLSKSDKAVLIQLRS